MSSQLCACCSAIPLDPELEKVSESKYDSSEWFLGSFGELRHRSCPFCELIASICYRGSGSSWEPLTPPADSTLINVKHRRGRFTVEKASPIGSWVCVAGQRAEVNSFCARAQFPEWIDLDDVHRWISTCEQKHGSVECSPATFNPAVLPRNGKRQLDFRLIDVEAMCIVYAPRQCRYIALSYVWGRRNKSRLVLTGDNEEALMEPGALALSKTRASIPNTILDAMSVVCKLQERYLWVDSLCLLQDDANELQDCVAIMDLFYEMAVLTIVAASGEDAWSGLPGVAPTPRRMNRLVRDIIPGLKMTTVVDMDTLLRRSVYSSRAWTMQEEILSNRLLVFINDQVYFQCPSAAYDEALNWPGREHHDKRQNASLYHLIFSTFTDFRHISMAITYYTARNFSFQSDVLRAAQGMLRKFSILSGLHCFEGLPPPLDRSLLFECEPRAVSRAFGRREGFPSYSWTGWRYASKSNDYLDGIYDTWNDKLVDENPSGPEPGLRCWIIWHCRLEDGKLFRIDNKGRLRKSPPPTAEDGQSKCRRAFQQIPVSVSDVDFGAVRTNSYPLLLFWTICVNLRLKRQSYSGESRMSTGQVNFAAFDRYGKKCGIAKVDTIMAEATEGKFALLAVNERSFWALMLKWEDDIAEKRGVARLSKEVLDTCLLPGPRWKAIVLG